MGTRASFWIGDPRNLQDRKLIGCKHFDGYPDAFNFDAVASAEQFEAEVAKQAADGDDWCPASDGFPYPWDDDLFLTDYTYAWFDKGLQVSCYHHGFVPWAKAQAGDEGTWPDTNDPSCVNVPAPSAHNGSAGGFIVFTTRA